MMIHFPYFIKSFKFWFHFHLISYSDILYSSVSESHFPSIHQNTVLGMKEEKSSSSEGLNLTTRKIRDPKDDEAALVTF